MVQLGVGVAERYASNTTAVVVLSLDMAANVLLQRVLCHLSGLTYRCLVQGSPELLHHSTGPYRTDEDKAAYRKGKRRLLDDGIADRIILLDRAKLGEEVTTAGLRQLLKEVKEMTGASRALLVVDYLQLIPVPDDVAAQNDLAAAKYQIQVVQDAVAATEDTPDWERDAVLAISEIRKQVTNPKQLAPLTINDVIGSGRVGYAADCVLIMNPTSDRELTELYGLEKDSSERRKRHIAQCRMAHAASRVSPITLDVVKARDGMNRGQIFLKFHYEQSLLVPFTADKDRVDADAQEPDVVDADEGNSKSAAREAEARETARQDRLRAAYTTLPAKKQASGVGCKALAKTAGNMNRASAKKSLERMVAAGEFEALPVEGKNWSIYRPIPPKLPGAKRSKRAA